MIRFLLLALLALLAADYAAFLTLDLLGAAAFLSCLLKFFGILLCALLQPRRPEGWLTVGADFFLLFFPALSPVGILIFCAAHTISEVRPERESIKTMLPRTVSCQDTGSAM